MNQGTLRPQKALFIGIQDRHERHLRQIQALPQQVHPHQNVVLPEAQILDDLDPLDRVNLRVEITHPRTVFGQVIGEIFRHPLGEGGHQHPLLLSGTITDFTQ